MDEPKHIKKDMNSQESNAGYEPRKGTSYSRKGISLRLGCFSFVAFIVGIYIVVVSPSLISRYFKAVDNSIVTFGFALCLLFILGYIIVNALLKSKDPSSGNIDEFSSVSNQYRILSKYAEKNKTNTSVEADSGRCPACGAKITRQCSNCPKCGRLIR
ncbi:MAG: hypothetical protein IJV88_04175 [Ruminococcus sp.]|nr:hypothetical protein [Ruminococcus sp.]